MLETPESTETPEPKGGEWPRLVEFSLSTEIGGRRTNVAHLQRAMDAAQHAFIGSLTAHSPNYTLTNTKGRLRFLYVGFDEES